MYIKFNSKGVWFFYGPWYEIKVHYGVLKSLLDKSKPMVFNLSEDSSITCNEIFDNDGEDYILISGWDEKGQYQSIALCGCQAYLLSAEGKTLERLSK